jgi:hypothetical protein
MNTEPATQSEGYIEGPEAFRRFDEGMTQILSVSRATLLRREREYKKKSMANPKRRGPKPKVKPLA